MHIDTIRDGCHREESTTSHTLICNALLGGNEIVTYIPCIEELYGEDEDEQVYITRQSKEDESYTRKGVGETALGKGPCEPVVLYSVLLCIFA